MIKKVMAGFLALILVLSMVSVLVSAAPHNDLKNEDPVFVKQNSDVRVFMFTVGNDGNDAVVQNFRLQIQAFDSHDNVVLNDAKNFEDDIAPGSTGRVSYEIPKNFQAEYVVLTVDPDNVVHEQNENNNKFKFDITTLVRLTEDLERAENGLTALEKDLDDLYEKYKKAVADEDVKELKNILDALDDLQDDSEELEDFAKDGYTLAKKSGLQKLANKFDDVVKDVFDLQDAIDDGVDDTKKAIKKIEDAPVVVPPAPTFEITEVKVNGQVVDMFKSLDYTNKGTATVEVTVKNDLNVDLGYVYAAAEVEKLGSFHSGLISTKDSAKAVKKGESATFTLNVPIATNIADSLYSLTIIVFGSEKELKEGLANDEWDWQISYLNLKQFKDADGDGVADDVDNCPGMSNADQKDTDGDKIGDVCDGTSGNTGSGNTGGDSTTTPATANEQKYLNFKSEYNDLDDDYDKYKKKYNKAVKDKDSKDIEKYEEKLEKVDDKLGDLDDDIEDFISDLEDENPQDDDLIEKAEDLEEDVENLQDKIADLLGKSTSQSSSLVPTTSNFVPSVAPAASSASDKPVTVQPFTNFQPPQTNGQVEESSWDSVRFVVYAIAGVIVLLAIIVFLIALLLH